MKKSVCFVNSVLQTSICRALHVVEQRPLISNCQPQKDCSYGDIKALHTAPLSETNGAN